MRRRLFFGQAILFGLFIFTLTAATFPFLGDYNILTKLDHKSPVYDKKEEYDPSLARLNSLDKLEKYCDSLYLVSSIKVSSDEVKKDYADIVSSVIRKRFYHGYSYYGFSDNFIALIASKFTLQGLSAIVIPDDILKFPYAACSQQSIVMMEVLRSKGFDTRKVSFQGKTAGHYSFEVYFDNAWHFYDTNMEPDIAVLQEYGRPDIAFLVNHKDILLKAYRQHPTAKILDVFPAYSYGQINEIPASNAMLFQKISLFLSNTIWLFFLTAFLLVHRRYLRLTPQTHVRNRRIYFPQSQPGTSSTYYPGVTASGT